MVTVVDRHSKKAERVFLKVFGSSETYYVHGAGPGTHALLS